LGRLISTGTFQPMYVTVVTAQLAALPDRARASIGRRAGLMS
jgi:hypothetical protein